MKFFIIILDCVGHRVARHHGLFFILLLLIFAAVPLRAEENSLSLMRLDILELMDIEVTSVSKKSQRLADTAAAVYIISGEEIRRSGVTSIPEALRMAPGVQVARIDANKWAVSIRGFNGRFANKLLVLMDGRSVYTPLFSGVYWEAQDTLMEDIDRIEIIRGPGAALWGANAVNGVINIITKSAEETLGGFVSATGGTHERGTGEVRYGASLTKDTKVRLYAKHLDRNAFLDISGNRAADAWHSTRGGFRLDSKVTDRDSLTFQGDYHEGKLGETYTLYRLPSALDDRYSWITNADSRMSGGNLLSRWQRKLSDSDKFSLQFYFDHSERELKVLGEKREIIDLDFQHQVSFVSRHELLWGLGYRFGHDELTNTPYIVFSDPHKDSHLFSAFLQDEISLVPERLALILGSRIEHNDATGFEFQPNIRMIWTPTSYASLWSSVSRAVRTPSRGDEDIQYRYRSIPPGSPINPGPLPLRLEIDGSHDFEAERLIAYEIGFRMEPLSYLSFDIAAFYNDYSKLRVLSTVSPYTEPVAAVPTNVVQPFILSNDMHGHVYGLELSMTWFPIDWWKVDVAYSYQQLAMYLDGTSTDTINRGTAEGSTPRHQFSLRSGFDLGHNVTLDLWLRGVDRLPEIDIESIPGYISMDARLAWKPLEDLEISLVGQNLLQESHSEFVPEFINTHPTRVERSFYGKVAWHF